jgi:hypothetical protein
MYENEPVVVQKNPEGTPLHELAYKLDWTNFEVVDCPTMKHNQMRVTYPDGSIEMFTFHRDGVERVIEIRRHPSMKPWRSAH